MGALFKPRPPIGSGGFTITIHGKHKNPKQEVSDAFAAALKRPAHHSRNPIGRFCFEVARLPPAGSNVALIFLFVKKFFINISSSTHYERKLGTKYASFPLQPPVVRPRPVPDPLCTE